MRHRSRLVCGLAALATAALSLVAIPPVQAAPPIAAADLNTAFATYADTAGRWAGGDGSVSVELPDGRIAWLFSDSFIGAVNADHSLPAATTMVNNAIAVQSGSALTSTITGGTPSAPASLVATGVADEFYWIGDAAVESGSLKAIYNRYRRTGTGSLDFALTGSWLAVFSLPGLTLSSITDRATGTDIAWGASLLADGGYTYIYGTELTDPSGLKFAHLARAAAGDLGGAWQYWTGSVWSSDPASSARLLSGVGTNFGVQKIGSQYVLVTMESNLVFNPQAVAYTAAAPGGPFTGPIDLFTAPEPAAGGSKPIIVYNAQLHPEQAPSGKLLVSYDVNSLKLGDVTADVRNYRPRFVEVAWPRPQPDPGSLPAAPTGLVATPDSSGIVHLAWNAVPGATYAVYQRDATSGQTHFVRSTTTAATSIDAGFLRTGRTYEFRITAITAAGEGPPSAVAAATVVFGPPPAPTGVTAVADTAGHVTVSWNAVPNAWSYDVYSRDLTAGDPLPALANGGLSQGTSFTTTEQLAHQHVYEFTVVAKHGGGSSPGSAPASATAFYAVPPAPTGLTASPQTDGTIRLNWTSSASDVWFNVYMRDVTAGEVTFTKLPLPITTCCAMTAGYLLHNHVYEFKVAATNQGGEGPQSAVATATSAYAVPAAPTGVTATAQSDGTIKLDWTTPGPDVWFNVYMRDVTAGESGFTKLSLPITTCCTMTAGYLLHNHAYQFKMAATNQGGEGPQSAVASATAQYPAPVTPTGLSVAAGDGQAVLTWSSADPKAWYTIYQRDVTAGETVFTKLPLPLTTCCTMTAGYLVNGHTYEWKVASTNEAGESAASAVVSGTPVITPPGQVTGLTATANGDGSITLNWTPPAQGLWFNIYQRDVTAGESGFTKLSLPITTCCTATIGLNYQINNHVYEYKMTATNGGEGPPSAVVSVTAHYNPPTTAPTNLRGVSAGDGSITLDWDSGPGVSFWVYMRDVTAGQSTFTKLAYPVMTCCTANLAWLADGHVYEWKVSAANQGGEGPASAAIQVTAHGGLPQAPSGLTVVPGNGQAQLSWTASPTPNVSYWVYQRDVTDGQTWQKLPLPVSSCCTMTAGYLANGHTYEWKVTASNASGDSPASNTVSGKPMPPIPAAPSNLAVSVGDGTVHLAWTASTTPNVWYFVYQRDVTAGQSFQQLPYPVTTCCTFDGGFLANGHTYEWKIVANNIAGNSGYSNTVSGRPMPPVPAAPSNLSVSMTVNSNTVRLTWTASPTPNVWYLIYQRDVTAGQSFQQLPYPVTSCCSFTGGLLTYGHQYEWKIVANNLAGNSGYTNTVSGRPMPSAPTSPTNVHAVAGDASVTLTWSASSPARVWYWVVVNDITAGDVFSLQYPVTSCCTLPIKYLWNGHRYRFTLMAENEAGTATSINAQSNEVTPMPPVPQAPTGLTGQTWLNIDGTISWTYLQWNNSPTPGVWHTLYFRDVTDNWPQWYYIGISGPAGSFLTKTSFTHGHVYDFQVSAANISGERFTNVFRMTPIRTTREEYVRLTQNGEAGYNTWKASKGSSGCLIQCGNPSHPGDTWNFNWSDDSCSAPWYAPSHYVPKFEMACVRHDFGYRNHVKAGYAANDENERGYIDVITMFVDAHRLCDQASYAWYETHLGCDSTVDLYFEVVRLKGSSHWDGTA